MSKTKKRNSSRKGDYGYLASRKKKRQDSYYSCFICSTFADFFLSNAIFSYKTDYLDCDSCCRLPSSLQISGQPDHDLSRQTSRNICIP